MSKGREGDWGERVRDACYKNPLLFISTDAGGAVMSNLLVCISERQLFMMQASRKCVLLA